MTKPPGTDLILRPARNGELTALSELCLRSKAVWGYDDALLSACRAELTLTAADLAESCVQVAERGGNVVGVAQVSVAGAQASLDKLFVEPAALRTGVGCLLLKWCVEAARAQSANTLTIESDPGASDFYRRMGARDVGFAPSGSIPGRMLPLLQIDL